MSTNTVEKTTLHFIKASATGTPVINYSGFDEQQEYSAHYGFEETEVINARAVSTETVFNLDNAGFQLTHFKPNEVDFLESEMVKADYYPQVEALIKAQTGAAHVVAFDHTVRRGIKASNRHPAYHVHNDYTHQTGPIRAQTVLDEAILKRFAGKRMVQINLWRSIAGVVEKDPLAFLDFSTLDSKDLVKAKISFNDMHSTEKHQGEIFALKKNNNQKWYYYPRMDGTEAILIKGFDSDPSYSRFAMHTAFPLLRQGDSGKPRQSIETRTYAFFDI